MDDGQTEELRKWALGLVTDGRPEVRAAAKAILLLTDDLQAPLARLVAYEARSNAREADIAEAEASQQKGSDGGSGLRARLSEPQRR
jgi:hypothetical protein